MGEHGPPAVRPYSDDSVARGGRPGYSVRVAGPGLRHPMPNAIASPLRRFLVPTTRVRPPAPPPGSLDRCRRPAAGRPPARSHVPAPTSGGGGPARVGGRGAAAERPTVSKKLYVGNL